MAKLYTDHNVAIQVARILRNVGHDVVTTRDSSLERTGDEDQLLTAAQQGRVLITHNAKHFFMLHDAWRRWSNAWHVTQIHAGILVIPQWPPLRAAQELDAFIKEGLSLSNELYLWQSSRGWVRRP